MTGYFLFFIYLVIFLFSLSGQPTLIIFTGFFQSQFLNPPSTVGLSRQPNWAAILSQKDQNYAYYTYTMQSKTLLKDDVQLSREVPFTYISSNFITFFYLTCTYRHSKLKKGMEGPEHQERHGSTRTSRNNCNLYNNNIEERCSTLKGSSIYINSVSNFIIFSYLTCTYRHSKLKKGMQVSEHQETTETCIYEHNFAKLFHCN